jgi:hypothetical protein
MIPHRKETGSMQEDLEALLRRKQDLLRGRPLTAWERFYESRIAHTDWAFVGFAVSTVIAAVCFEFVLIAKLFFPKP